MDKKIEKILPVVASLFLIVSGFFNPIVMAIGGGILLIFSFNSYLEKKINF